MKHVLRLVNSHNKTITSYATNIFTLTFRSVPETFIRRSSFSSSSALHDRDVTWQEIGHTCGLACVAALVPGQGSSNLFPNMYCFFDLPNTFVRFSVQNYSGMPINHMVILRCVASQCWFVLLKQTWCTLVSGKRFGSYVLQLRLMFFQSCTKLSSYIGHYYGHPMAKGRPLYFQYGRPM